MHEKELDPEMVTMSLLRAPITCMKVFADKVSSGDGIGSGAQNYNREDLMDALTRISYDMMIVKSVWDLKNIWNETFVPVTTSIKIVEVFQDAIEMMRQKNIKKGIDIALQFDSESFHKVVA